VRCASDSSAPDEPADRVGLEHRATAALEMAHVLIAEDVGMQAALVRRYLSGVHDVVDVVDTAEDALAAVEERHPDVVVMDLNLREGNGVEATEAITALDRDVGVVVSTVYADEAMRERALDAGADAYLVKPYDRDALLAVVESALE